MASHHHVLDPEEWDKVLGQMLQYHQNISDEIRDIITQIRKEMNQDLVPKAEDRANYGKIVKQSIRRMWGLEYEIEDIQTAFAKQLGSIDLDNLTDDFVEDALLQSKPLQGVLHAIRERQRDMMEEMKKKYGEHILQLEPLKVPRPPKPEPKPDQPPPKPEDAMPAEVKPEEGKPAESQPVEEAKPTDEAKPAEEAPAPEPAEAPAEEAPKEPEPAVEAVQEPPVVEASA